jgi:hypothetical protein
LQEVLLWPDLLVRALSSAPLLFLTLAESATGHSQYKIEPSELEERM